MNARSYAEAETMNCALAVPAADIRDLRMLIMLLEQWLKAHAGASTRADLDAFLDGHPWLSATSDPFDAAGLAAYLADTGVYLTDLLVNADIFGDIS